jgi:hypothetical protein
MTSPVWRVRVGRSSLGLACVTMGLLSALLSADAAAQSTALVPWRPGDVGSFQVDTLEERASVAILDIGLPGMDGYQLAGDCERRSGARSCSSPSPALRSGDRR